MVQPVKVFYCYASADEDALLKLEKWLKPLELLKKIVPWHRRKILPGANSIQEVEAHLDQAEIIILLVSPDFLESNYSNSSEMEHALRLHRGRKARVVPVILRHCLWNVTPLGELQPLPQNSRPISAWSKEDAAWHNVGTGILALIEEMQKQAKQEPEPKTNETKARGKQRAGTRKKSTPMGGPITGAMAPVVPTKSARKPHKARVIESPPPYRERELAIEEEPEPATPEAQKATPEYNQQYNNLQDKIIAVSLKILVWEPDTPTEGIIAEKRRAIFLALAAEKHQCQLGKSLPVPPGASLQDSEVEHARKSDTTILLVEPPAVVEMSEFCKHEDVVEKTLVFYPKELESPTGRWTLERKLHVRFHLQYYQEQDIILNHVLSEVLNWVMAQRSFRYSNIA